MLVLVSQKMVDLIFGHVEGIHHGAWFSHGAVHNDTNPSMSGVAGHVDISFAVATATAMQPGSSLL